MKRIKMLLYGEPGVGKSVFATKAPKPFFICTDGNYEWLEEFGADPNAHINVSSWSEMKEVFKRDFDGYETIVIDLLEDAFKWCEHEYCVRNNIEHVSDVGYGKAYDATRNEFFVEISKLLSKDKHVILICHSITFTVKDRRGVEHTKYAPSSRIPDKVLDMIEGRVRYCLRCYTAAEEEPNGKITKRRFLSLVPKENEFGIIRGVDENAIPHDIPLDFDAFVSAIGLSTEIAATKAKAKKTKVVKDANEIEEKVETKIEVKEKTESKPKSETKVIESETASVEATKEEKLLSIKAKLAAIRAKKENLTAKTEPVETTKEVAQSEPEVENTTQDTQETITVSADAPYADENETSSTTETIAMSDKLAAIKAKLAAMKAKK